MFTISVDAIRALFILYLMFFFFFGPLFFFARTEDRRSGACPMCWYGWKRAGEICALSLVSKCNPTTVIY